MTTSELMTMSEQELEELNQRLSAERDAIRERQKAIARVMDKKAAEKSVRDKLAGMSDEEKALMRRLLEAEA